MEGDNFMYSNSSDNATYSNAIVENWFRIVKHSILNSETGIRAADFIRTVHNNIYDRIAAFKFAFTTWLIVFKLKRLRENKEEWLEVRRVNLVILNQLLIKVSTIFTNFKSSKVLM